MVGTELLTTARLLLALIGCVGLPVNTSVFGD